MTHPIWEDWQRHDQGGENNKEDFDVFFLGRWKGFLNDGRLHSVPCVYTELDVLNSSPAEIRKLRAAMKKNGLDSYYDSARLLEAGFYIPGNEAY